MSQTAQDHVGEALHEIGLRRASRQDEPSHLLLHPEEGLDHARLTELGRGKTLGCPAGKLASPETRKFLLDTYGIKVRTSMLYEYAAMINSRFNTDVREWVNGLTPEQQSASVTPENLRVISGEVWRSVAAQVTPGKCPFPGFRK